ncbi:MAG TPA: hypothetical protein EYQ06_07125 [Flavobacteriales bacterium]|nr:hypothetical protein [Flavobacteriales bacterium]
MKKILTQLPVRTSNPRENGLTMMMDKGLSFRQAEDFLASNIEHTDIIKLGFGTSIITPNVANKIKLYQDNGMMVYAGGTLFEVFAIRKQLDDYKKYMEDIGLNMVEISDGSMHMEHDVKCEIISDFAKDFKVISEVGSKDASVEISSENWLKWMQNELSAGSFKVIGVLLSIPSLLSDSQKTNISTWRSSCNCWRTSTIGCSSQETDKSEYRSVPSIFACECCIAFGEA